MIHFPIAILVGHSYACMAFFAHELTHGAILKRGPLRRILEEVLWGLNLIPVTLWKVVHNQSHHVETNTLHDPDRRFLESERNLPKKIYSVALYPSKKTLRWNPLVFVQLFGYIARQIAVALGGGSLNLLPSVPKYTLRQRLMVCAEIAMIVSFQFGLCAAVGFHFFRYMFLGPVALAVTSVIVMTYVFTNHFLNPIHDEPDPLTATTSVIVPKWLDILHCHFSYHTKHHLFPSMDSRYYPLLGELLSKHYPDKYNRIALSTAWNRLWKSELFALNPEAVDPSALSSLTRN
jgi:fatty acid desaturase